VVSLEYPRGTFVSQPYIYQLASQNAHWLSDRQSIVATNVANASTPGYRARDVVPFENVLAKTQVTMAVTNPAHLTPAASETEASATPEEDGAEATISGNSVDLEQEMLKVGEINRSFTLNNNIKRVFHQMFLAALK